VLGPSVGATLQTCAFAVALFRHRLLELVPAVSHLGESDAIEDLDDGVVIVDDDGAVVRLNPAARRVLDVGADGAIGVDVRQLLPELDDGAPAETTVERSGRTYRVTRSAITGRGDRPVGQTFLFRDVTDRERREQRLEVLSRVLRHNLRNDVDAIEGHASFVEHETDGDVARSAGTIRSLALGMAELGDKARLAQETLDDDADPEVVELASLVDRVVDDAVAALPDYDPDVAVTVPDDAGVATYPTPLAVALGNVVENAIEHAGSPTPTVRIRATVGDGRGSGGPAGERRGVGGGPGDVAGRPNGGGATGRRSSTNGDGAGSRAEARSDSGSAGAADADGATDRPGTRTGSTDAPEGRRPESVGRGASATGIRNGGAAATSGDENGAASDSTPASDAGNGTASDAAGRPADGTAGDAGTSDVEIVVEDDGPGIPDHQVAVLEEGAETPLLHGNGIGLWLVHWAVGTLRGDVEFERIPDGSRVRIRVPALDGDGTDRTRTAEPREGRTD
jgi:signal transduction histidine kinase